MVEGLVRYKQTVTAVDLHRRNGVLLMRHDLSPRYGHDLSFYSLLWFFFVFAFEGALRSGQVGDFDGCMRVDGLRGVGG